MRNNMRRALFFAIVFAATTASGDGTVSLLRTDDGGTRDGGPTFNGFAVGSAVHAKGDLSKDDIGRVVDAHRGEITACYDALLKRVKKGAPVKGTAKLKFEVAPDGTVDSASLGPGSLDEAAFVSCVVDHVLKWKFPQPRGGGYVKVNYPMLLEPD